MKKKKKYTDSLIWATVSVLSLMAVATVIGTIIGLLMLLARQSELLFYLTLGLVAVFMLSIIIHFSN